MNFYKYLRSFLFLLSPEKAHSLAVFSLKNGILPKPSVDNNSHILSQNLWGLNFPNPVGLAAGFDKNAEIFDEMSNQGFGFVETGTVTPLAQTGNPKPRIFRLTEDHAVINRLGFNNKGLEPFINRLKMRKNNHHIVGANIGANKTSEDPVNDYVVGLKKLLGLADYFTINISSPNTPGLRALQSREALDELLGKMVMVRDTADSSITPPLFVKIAPDLSSDECRDIADILLKHKMDGLIVSNTTISRGDDLQSAYKQESGGLSGRPLFEKSTKILSDMYKFTEGKIPLIGVGGISTGKDAYAKIRAGATLVQVYSALIYHGPTLAIKINEELEHLLIADGFDHISQAIGIDHTDI
jgi:dihydroorotate dehydrogenase